MLLTCNEPQKQTNSGSGGDQSRALLLPTTIHSSSITGTRFQTQMVMLLIHNIKRQPVLQ